MKYSDLCQAFYIKKGSSGLKNKKSQHAIGEFFVLLTIDKAQYEAVLPTSDDAFAKWYSGNTCPRTEIWDALSKTSAGKYAENLGKELNVKNIDKVAANLKIDIRRGETLDVDRFAGCIAELVLSLAEGHGETDKEAKDFYLTTDAASVFADYIRYARERYNLMKLIGGEEVFLDDYFVCNSIGEKIKAGVD